MPRGYNNSWYGNYTSSPGVHKSKIQDLFLALRECYEDDQSYNNIYPSDRVMQILNSVFQELFSQKTEMLLESTIREVQQRADQKIKEAELHFLKKTNDIETILRETLKLYSSIALVSDDPKVRESVERLSNIYNLNISEQK